MIAILTGITAAAVINIAVSSRGLVVPGFVVMPQVL